MYVCLHSDSTGVAALQQADAVKRLICDPPSFLQPGLDHHSRWHSAVRAAVEQPFGQDLCGALCDQLDVAVSAVEAIAQQEALAGWKQWLLDKAEAGAKRAHSVVR
eukprot:6441320-Pyramimonas_sp.AAC.1